MQISSTPSPGCQQETWVLRPWGYFEILSSQERHCIKRIVVHPGSRLSLQRHQMRAEHWYVIEGAADVQVDGKVYALAAGQSIDIAKMSWHRLGNPGSGPLTLLEIQTGDACEEGDIERVEDDYGRLPTAAESRL